MALNLKLFDAADYLTTPEHVAAFIESALEDGTPDEIRHALRAVARSKGMAQVAKDAELSREALYKALGDNGNPTLDTLARIAKALGMRISLVMA